MGILDADIYGPSLPSLISPEDKAIRRSQHSDRIEPVIFEGIKCMSYGFVNKKAAPGAGGNVSTQSSRVMLSRPRSSDYARGHGF